MVSHLRFHPLYSYQSSARSWPMHFSGNSGSSSGCRSCIAVGHATLALIGSPVAHMIEPRILLAIGLFKIAMGAGGIKPCVSTNVGDQFGESNKHLLTRLFNWFYFSINAGSAISTLLIPWLLEPYSADPNGLIALRSGLHLPRCVFWNARILHSPDIAFGLPGIFMAIADCHFLVGPQKSFSHIPPAGLRDYARDSFQPGNRQDFAEHSDSSSVCGHLLGAVAAKLFLLDRSGGSDGPASLRH